MTDQINRNEICLKQCDPILRSPCVKVGERASDRERARESKRARARVRVRARARARARACARPAPHSVLERALAFFEGPEATTIDRTC